MLKSSASLALGLTFLAIGGVNVWLILASTAPTKTAKTSARLIAAHRIGGYLFIALFCVMAYFMSARLGHLAEENSSTVAVHFTLAMLLTPLLLVKVVIARYYKNQYRLMPLGLAIFVLAFVLIASTAAPHLARSSKTEDAALPSLPRRSGYSVRTIGFISFVFLSTMTLVIRRPGKPPVTTAIPEAVRSDRAATLVPTGPMVLQLARITPQTPDSKTLCFVVSGNRKLNARPGQFLTFSFLFDGKKHIRCYSICSSPTRPNYVEITPKRVNQGGASAFLNNRAYIGMTVEASGPSGQFCFDETKHKNVVLIAAGSGITPMMAMLRYIGDLCLDTVVTLLYCVRTGNDIIFRDELNELKLRLNHFQYHVLLSQPGPEWQGARGRISREFVTNSIRKFERQQFFLCGPLAFMEAVREILTELGVEPEQILQESFGGGASKTPQEQTVTETSSIVEFARSGRVCSVPSGQTLLEAAEEHGVPIPFSCRQGQCGTCGTALLEGKVIMATEEGLDPDLKARGIVLLCVGHPNGPVKLDA